MTPSGAQACQVVPDIASFAVDDGFTYEVPDEIEVDVGSRVRVKVGGRRTRGFVTAVVPRPSGRELSRIEGVVGSIGSFDTHMLEFLRWCATYYVSPLSTILRRTVPPNVPNVRARAPIARVTKDPTIEVVVSASPHTEVILERISLLEAGESALVVVPSMEESLDVARALTATFGTRVVMANSGMANKDVTASWGSAATVPGTILVGTREIVLWPVGSLRLMMVVEDARRVMKSPATPTLSVREIAIGRSAHGGVPLSFATPVPSLEVLDRRPTIVQPPGRQWGLIEILDRSEEPPSASPILEGTRTAIVSAANRGEHVFVLVPRRGYARAVRCAACGDLRVCRKCQAVGSNAPACERCGTELVACTNCGGTRWRALGAGVGSVIDDLTRSLGRQVGRVGEERLVTVGTERDLIGLHDVSLAVAVDIDSVAMAPTYRAPEDAMRLAVRLSHTVARGRGHRTLVQTSAPHQPVVEALRSGRWEDFLAAEASTRDRSGFPPFGQLIALEVAHDEGKANGLIQALAPGAEILGPALVNDRQRWLIQGEDLAQTKIALRSVVRTLRDRGARVRIDVDPVDL